jgi:acyl-CoA synthetase (AMP-forming)/AMP-acid ligase II
MVAAERVARASISTVSGLFVSQVRQHPDRIAIEDWGSSKIGSAEPIRRFSYRQLEQRMRALAAALVNSGVARGDRVALLSENRAEYLEVFLAAGSLGASVACQNWRLSATELSHCIRLVEPRLVLVSPRYADALPSNAPQRWVFGAEYEALLERAAPHESRALASEPISSEAVSSEAISPEAVSPEDGLLILYTSGTTGLPKGAVLSHRAEIMRNLVVRAEFGIAPEDTFAAWSPLYHMGAAECSLGALMSGGKVITLDGFDAARLGDVVEQEQLGWLLLMPGMVANFAAELEQRSIQPCSVKLCGVMADLVPPAEIARITRLLGAPYANTFGATETGCPPCSSNRIPIGVAPSRLSKQQSPFCEVKLVDPDDHEVPDGTPGELCIRGPTLFSGYFRNDETNAQEFRGGWFHMGDVFVRNPDGSLDFVDRVKYLIKSGGENIYPAEIERVILQDERVLDCAVVRKADAKWGEVPVAFVARHTEALEATDIYRRCRRELAGYKQPKEIYFIAASELPRSASGKIQRHELEKRLAAPPGDKRNAP